MGPTSADSSVSGDEAAELRQRITSLEEQLEQTREAADGLPQQSDLDPLIPWIAAPDGGIVDFSPRWLELTGFTKAEAIGAGWTNVVHAADLQATAAAWSHSMETGEPYDVEHRIRLTDGSYCWMRSRAFARCSLEGVILRWDGTTENTHVRKLTDIQRRAAEDRLRLSLEAGGGVGTWDWDIPADRIYSDTRCASLFSLDPDRAAAGEPSAEYMSGVHPDDRALVTERIRLALAADPDYAVEYRVLPKDGSVRWLLARGRCHRDATGYPLRLSGVVLDITERKKAEQALLESEARFRFLAESIPQMVWTATPDGALDYVNTKGTSYFGVPEQALLGTGWLSGVHPDDQPQAVQRWRQSLETGEPYEILFRLRRGSDGSWHWHLVRALALIRDDGAVSQWFGTCTDIEAQKAAEAELRRANRELEEFAYVASHDLQEPLRMVNIYTQLVLKRAGDGDATQSEYAAFVRQGVLRMESLLRDLLTFSRTAHKDELPIGVANLSVSLTEALSVLKSRIEETGAIIQAVPLPMVRGDTAQLAHVFQNLLSNALKYRRVDLPAEVKISVAQAGEEWIIAVEDNGIGFQPQYAERIFGLFRRLHKDEYPGTGLGLAICQRIVQRYGGRIWAEGRPGQGATFFFALSRVPGQGD